MLTSLGVPPDMSVLLGDYIKYVVIWVLGILVMIRCHREVTRNHRGFGVRSGFAFA